MSCIIGVDIGGTYARIGAVSKNGNVIAMKKVKQNQIFNGENVIEQLIRFLDTFMTSTEDVRDVQAIAIGFPATLDKNRTKVVQAPNISGIDHTEIVEPLEKYFNLPVFIEKDVCMALFYDACKYHLSLDGITVACYIGTGIGNAICIHGEVLTGKDGAACELGHIPILGNREKCGCGNEGCLENIAGGKALNRLCRDVFKDTQVSDIFSEKAETDEIQAYIDAVSVAVATEINILNPDTVVLGGGVLSMHHFPKQLLEQRIRQHTRKPYPEKTLHLLWAEDDMEKGVAGAALYARKKLNEISREEAE